MSDPFTQLSAEEKLLISLCRLEFTDEQKKDIGELMKEIKDWNHFVNLSNQHGIIALCWYNLTEIVNTDQIPAGYLDKMHSAYLKSLTRNTFLYKQLEEITSLAKKGNIKIVLLKGMALEKTVYGNKGLRQMNDIDILVKQNEAATLRRILLKNGYETAPLVSKFHEKIMPAYGKHLPEMYKNGIAVEIHFKLFDQKGISLTEEFLNKATRIPGNDTNIYCPDPQLFFLYLIRHLEKHEKSGSSQLRLYADLVVLLSFYSDHIINEQLFGDVHKANLEITFSEKPKLLEIYWGIILPEPVNKFTEKANSEIIKKKFIKFLRHPNDDQVEEEQESLFKIIKEVPGITDRILLFIGHIFPSLAYIKYRYKIKTTAWAILCYPVRWVRQFRLLVKRHMDEGTWR